MQKQCAFQNRLTTFTWGTLLFDSAFVLMQVYSAFLQEILHSLQATLNRIKFFFMSKNQIGTVRILEEKKKW